MAGGGLMQLVAYGAQDIFLIGNTIDRLIKEFDTKCSNCEKSLGIKYFVCELCDNHYRHSVISIHQTLENYIIGDLRNIIIDYYEYEDYDDAHYGCSVYFNSKWNAPPGSNTNANISEDQLHSDDGVHHCMGCLDNTPPNSSPNSSPNSNPNNSHIGHPNNSLIIAQ